jgi:transcriptional regulator with XRE-family HTH domain
MIIKSEEIKRLRTESGLTQNDVAVRLGVSEATISRYESGQIKKVSPSVLLGLSKLFRVPLTALYENAETEWVAALQEARLHDPRVAGFIEYLEEQAQKENCDIILSHPEEELIVSYRKADPKTRHLVEFALGIASDIEAREAE